MDAILFILFGLFLLTGAAIITARAWYNNKQYEAEKLAANTKSAE